MIDQVIRLTNRRPVATEKLCLRLGVSETRLRREVTQARASGFEVQIIDGQVITKPRYSPGEVVTIGSTKPGRYTVGLFTDIHAGSSHCLEDEAAAFLKRAKRRGVQCIVSTGDLLDGNRSVLLPDQHCWRQDAQIAVLKKIVRVASGVQWVAIDGNHDGYHSAVSGFTSGKLLETEMRAAGLDWNFAGVCLGRAIVHGARWHLWHPHGGASTRNAIRRILNERGESLAEPCDIIAMGHFHKYVSLPIIPEGIHGVAGGTFQAKKSEFGNRITRPWDIGGVFVSYTLHKNGTVSEISAEFEPAK